MSRRFDDLFVYRDLTADELDFYWSNGYLIYGRALTDRGLDQMLSECMAAWDREQSDFDPNRTWRQNSQIGDIHHQSETLRQYYFNGPIVDAAEKVISPNLKGVTAVLIFKMPGNTQPTEWHQDNIYGELNPYNAISCLTAMDDSTLQNGCTWILPGSHKRGQIAFSYTEEEKKAEKPVILDVDPTGEVPLELKAGECVFFHCHTLHRAGGNPSDKPRRLLFTRYADADAVEAYNNDAIRPGKLLRGDTKYDEVRQFEADLPVH